MTKFILPKDIGLEALPEQNYADVKFIFNTDWYDGPISGLCEVNGKEYWFELVTEDYKPKKDPEEMDRIRVFALIDLGKTRFEEEKLWHKLFELLVRDNKDLRPSAMHDRFYKPYAHRPETEIGREQIIAQFVEKP